MTHIQDTDKGSDCLFKGKWVQSCQVQHNFGLHHPSQPHHPATAPPPYFVVNGKYMGSHIGAKTSARNSGQSLLRVHHKSNPSAVSVLPYKSRVKSNEKDENAMCNNESSEKTEPEQHKSQRS